ncbi:MAG: hypothetical protein QME93_01250 [Bacillota bacterium]|nr:hypothetical protein [Bacillota bacterium]MDI7248679.1 hypothetical protein [Bacillota bacterium]
MDLYARGSELNGLKSQYLKRFGITARMFNAIRVTLEGKVKAAREAGERHARRLKEKIRSLEESLADLEQRLGRARGPGSRRSLRFQIHHKKRRLAGLQARLLRGKAGRGATPILGGTCGCPCAARPARRWSFPASGVRSPGANRRESCSPGVLTVLAGNCKYC